MHSSYVHSEGPLAPTFTLAGAFPSSSFPVALASHDI